MKIVFMTIFLIPFLNPFQANVSFLYPLKIPESLWFSNVFREYSLKWVIIGSSTGTHVSLTLAVLPSFLACRFSFFFYMSNGDNIFFCDVCNSLWLYWFSVQTFIKTCISWSTYFSKPLFSVRYKNPLTIPFE